MLLFFDIKIDLCSHVLLQDENFVLFELMFSQVLFFVSLIVVHLIAVVLGLLVFRSNKLFLSFFFHVNVDLVDFLVLVHGQNRLVVVGSDFLNYFFNGLLDVNVLNHVLLFRFLLSVTFSWGFNLFDV